MLDIIYSLFQTIIHGITTILNMILSIPKYVTYLVGLIGLMPTFISVPILIVIIASIVIGLKRLVF